MDSSHTVSRESKKISESQKEPERGRESQRESERGKVIEIELTTKKKSDKIKLQTRIKRKYILK